MKKIVLSIAVLSFVVLGYFTQNQSVEQATHGGTWPAPYQIQNDIVQKM